MVILKNLENKYCLYGYGRALDNIESLLPAVNILKDPWGLGIAPRRITVSTAGHLDGLRLFIKSNPNVSLALSLHSPDNSLRNKIMPINKKYPLMMYFQSWRTMPKNKRNIFIQYTLFLGVNDSLKDALALAESLRVFP